MSSLCIGFNFPRFYNFAGPDVFTFSALVTTSVGKLID